VQAVPIRKQPTEPQPETLYFFFSKALGVYSIWRKLQTVPIRKQPQAQSSQAQNWQRSRTDTSASRSHQETTDRTTTRNPVFFLFKSTWSLPHLGETPNRSHQEATTSAKLTGAKLAAFPNCYQCKPFPSGNNHRRKAHKRKIGSVPELIPEQAAYTIRWKLKTGNPVYFSIKN
jgi:hypothetical protein